MELIWIDEVLLKTVIFFLSFLLLKPFFINSESSSSFDEHKQGSFPVYLDSSEDNLEALASGQNLNESKDKTITTVTDKCLKL